MTVPPPGGPVPVPVYVDVVCTGKGKHRRLSLQIFVRYSEAGEWFEEHGKLGATPVRDKCASVSGRSIAEQALGTHAPDLLYPLPCRRCGRRNTQVNFKTLTRELDSAAAGDGVLDISHLTY